ncbi:hypothetical protein [Nocardiopsis gilva]|uniref:hypothetical protein n=1 Tax=Nocardiopsis gilva TaxID=280236 RepID=UPI00373AF038
MSSARTPPQRHPAPPFRPCQRDAAGTDVGGRSAPRADDQGRERSDGKEQLDLRNALFQQWEAMLTNRDKRQSPGLFLIRGSVPSFRKSTTGGRSTVCSTRPTSA